VVFGDTEITDGAVDDIEKVSSLVRKMVKEWGMSNLGQFNLEDTECSEDLASKIDFEVSRIIFSCYDKAKQIIQDHRPLIDYLVDVLLEKETIDGDHFREIVAEFKPSQLVLVKS
jgi:cell division protease FtsH